MQTRYPSYNRNHLRAANARQHAFERRLAVVLIATGLLLGINAWVVKSGHVAGNAPWQALHPTAIGGLRGHSPGG
jgi:hypothetical protein